MMPRGWREEHGNNRYLNRTELVECSSVTTAPQDTHAANDLLRLFPHSGKCLRRCEMRTMQHHSDRDSLLTLCILT